MDRRIYDEGDWTKRGIGFTNIFNNKLMPRLSNIYLDPVTTPEQIESVEESIINILDEIPVNIETDEIPLYFGNYTKTFFKKQKPWDWEQIRHFIEDPLSFTISDKELEFSKNYIVYYSIKKAYEVTFNKKFHHDKAIVIMNNPKVWLTVNFLQLRKDNLIKLTKEKLSFEILGWQDHLQQLLEDQTDVQTIIQIYNLKLKIGQWQESILEKDIPRIDGLAKESINIQLIPISNKNIDLDNIDNQDDPDNIDSTNTDGPDGY